MRLLRKLSRRLPYQQKLFFSFGGLNCLILLVGLAATSVLVANMLIASEKVQLGQTLEIVNTDLNSRIKDVSNTAFELAVDGTIRENLNQTDDLLAARASTKVESSLKSRIISSNVIQGITILDTCNHCFSPNVSFLLPKDFRLEEAEVMRQLGASDRSVVFLSENDLVEKYANFEMYRPKTEICAAARIIDYTHNQLLGLVLLFVRSDFFEKIDYPEGILQSTQLCLVSPDRKMILPIGTERHSLSAYDLELLMFDENQTIISQDDRLISYRYNDAMGWYLVSVTQMTFLSHGMWKITGIFMAVLLSCILLTFFLSRHLAVVHTKGISELIDAMRHLEEGDFSIHLTVEREDEIGEITKTFVHLSKRLEYLIQTEYKENLLMREAQFKALQSQIQPHFLMNAFDMLHWRLMDAEQVEIAESVVALSHLMRYTMVNNNSPVSLSMELQNVREYVALHQITRDGEYQLTEKCTDAERILLPRQTLQPLVENAFRHGFERRQRGNRIWIEGDYLCERRRYRLTISDNGLGMPQEKVDELNEMLKANGSAAAEHLGIVNVAMRLRYLDSTATIRYFSEYGSGTKAVIELECTEKGDQDENCAD